MTDILAWYSPHTLPRMASLGLLALRLVYGLAFALHGSGKIVNAFGWMGPDAPVPGLLQALAALSEFGGGIAVALGLFTPLAALGLLATMGVAVALVHGPAGHPFVAATPGAPSYELAAIYGVIAWALLCIGPGRYALDAWLLTRRRPGAGC